MWMPMEIGRGKLWLPEKPWPIDVETGEVYFEA